MRGAKTACHAILIYAYYVVFVCACGSCHYVVLFVYTIVYTKVPRRRFFVRQKPPLDPRAAEVRADNVIPITTGPCVLAVGALAEAEVLGTLWREVFLVAYFAG